MNAFEEFSLGYKWLMIGWEFTKANKVPYRVLGTCSHSLLIGKFKFSEPASSRIFIPRLGWDSWPCLEGKNGSMIIIFFLMK